MEPRLEVWLDHLNFIFPAVCMVGSNIIEQTSFLQTYSKADNAVLT
jgi:hypothetical protein